MEKMNFETPDITAKNIEKIAEIFPNCITETTENGKLKKAINFEMLRQILSGDIADNNECYEFTWVGKKSAIIEANKSIRKTLRPCIDESVNFEKTENIYIEGDNLEVLKLLQESYLNKIKMIYIDPPYNTGNDFIYNDDFKMSEGEYLSISGKHDKNGKHLFRNTDTNGRFHSDWCSMIYSRLMLARNLLSDDGVIFISIDENEMDNLKKICDEIFGAQNRIPIFNRVTKKSSNNGNHFSPCIDYILIYAKKISAVPEYKIGMSYEITKRYNKKDEYFNERGSYQEVGLFMSALKHGGSSYPIECPDGTKVCPPDNQPWRWNEETFLKGKKENRIVFKKTKTSPLLDEQTGKRAEWNIYTKVYLKEREVSGMHPKNYSDAFQNTLASNELRKIGIPFDFAKPVELLEFLIGLQCDKNDIILDFFSGSATTAHAIMQLNAKDGGNRKFIMVQLPEPCDEKSEAFKAGYKNICEIGKERIRRAGDKIKSENPMTTENLDTGFRVLKLDSTNMEDVYYSPLEITQNMLMEQVENIKPDRTDLDLLFSCMLEWGLLLSMPYTAEKAENCTIHIVNNGDLIACFDKNIPESVMQIIAEKKPLMAVFRDLCFETSSGKINSNEIFKMISPDTRIKII
ncbi:MAG: site-specific DNA-methyltransferase [Ruminococcus sp.]|nr:site-specific DNA-methyltransferase [Ruminococcus sp.]